MTFTELIEWVAQYTGESKAKVRRILLATIHSIGETVVSGGSVNLPGLGKFSKKVIRPGVSPPTTFGGPRHYGGRATFGFRSRMRFEFKDKHDMEKDMEKLGVVIDDEKTKTAGTKRTCPKCGTDMSLSSTQHPNKCPNCGTEPFEKKP